jgi:hypothetical protein
MKRFKWHILPLARTIICGSDLLPLNSNQIDKAAQKVIGVMGQHGESATVLFERIAGICQGLGDVSADRLKRQAILTEMLAAI